MPEGWNRAPVGGAKLRVGDRTHEDEGTNENAKRKRLHGSWLCIGPVGGPAPSLTPDRFGFRNGLSARPGARRYDPLLAPVRLTGIVNVAP